MKRDMDLIRTILLDFEANDRLDGTSTMSGFEFEGQPDRTVEYHLALMAESGLIVSAPAGMHTPGVVRLTSFGHDYLDTIRDPEVWRKTKAGAKKVGGLSLELMGDLAKGFLKAQVRKHTDVDLDL